MAQLNARISVQPVRYPRLQNTEPENPIRLLEELSLSAWPALQTSFDDGWVLRFADGYTRRANSVNPIYPSAANIDEKIKRCEAIYSARHLNVTFKMTPLVYPENLDDILERKRYKEDAVTSVQTRSLAALEPAPSATVSLASSPSDEWLDAFCRMNAIHERNRPIMQTMLNSIVPQKCFVALRRDERIAAAGLAVLDQGYVGLYDIVTDPTMRRQGLGMELILNLLNWGKSNGAHHAYLQVMVNNTPAVRLYQKLGFREVYQYWYRVKSLN